MKQAAWAASLLLGGCGTFADLSNARIADANPVDWWHNLEGGAIAEARPDPPGASDPYPNLAAVPARPVPTPQAQRVALTAQLAAERDGVRRDTARDPLAAAPVPAAPKPPQDPASVPPPMATLDAASAPPAPPVPRPAQTEPLPAFVPAPVRAQPPGRAALPSGPMPELPAGPPPTPVLPGIPSATFAPAQRRSLPSLSIAFLQGDDAVPPGTQAAVQALADRRGGGPVLVYAGGDAVAANPQSQGPALALALRRAQAIGRVLAVAGVPPAQTRIQAAALGRASGVRLVD